jgi:hypothetical protein
METSWIDYLWFLGTFVSLMPLWSGAYETLLFSTGIFVISMALFIKLSFIEQEMKDGD